MPSLRQTTLAGLRVVALDVHGDERGFFVERFNRVAFADLGLPTDWVQDNHSRSAPGVLRGLHYQTDPPQGKLIGVVRGRVWDVAVDIRPDSPTFGRHHALELTGPGGLLLFVPPGFAHGFCVLGDEPADMLYKVDAPWSATGEGGIRFDDPDLAVPWPIDPATATTSARDQAMPSFADYRRDPPRWAGVPR